MEVCRLGFKTYILARVSQLYSRTIDKIGHGPDLVKKKDSVQPWPCGIYRYVLPRRYPYAAAS